jgi:hypothetical protein
LESAVAEVFAVADLDEMVIDPVPFALVCCTDDI